MKGKASPILVMVGLVFSGGWSARADPLVTLSTDEIKQEDAAGIRASRRPSPEHTRTHEQELQGDREAVHQHDSDTHEHGADTHQHDSGTHQHGADTHEHGSDTGEHMTDAEEMDSHPRMHETGRMESGTKGNHGGRMRGGH